MDATRVFITKLNNQNYQSWKYKVELLLIKEGLWDLVEVNPPAERNVEWLNRDGKAKATIGLLVEDDQLVHIRSTKSAKEAWNALKEYHEKSTLSSRIFLLKKLCTLKLSEHGNLEEHLNKMIDWYNQLVAIWEDMNESFLIGIIFCGLPESYNSLINVLESKAPNELTLSVVKGKLLDEYHRRVNCSAQSSTMGDTALKTKSNNFRKKEDSTKLSDCYFCKKKGHLKKDCWKYKNWKEQKEKVNKTEDTNNDDFCFSAHADKSDSGAWFIDSGATSHMTSDKKFFNTLDTNKKNNVTVADGKVIEVEGTGTGSIKCINNLNEERTVTIKDVLYVPDLHGNLLSVKKITDNGFKTVFNETECNITKNNIIVATAESIGNLYRLKDHKALLAQSQHKENCIHSWHRKLGHRDPEAIRRIVKEILASNIKIEDCGIKEACDTCIQGKLSRKPFPKRTEKAKEILDLVHTDICGPMQTATPSGKRYVLTLIDDCSGYTEVRLLAHKSDVNKGIKEYVALVKNKFNKKPKVIRSDRGREYVNAELTNYLKTEGIQIQLTAPCTPQQNGIAERKNRYLIEMTRCMLIDSGFEKKYWGEAVLTANYIQNRLPSRMRSKSSYEYWHGTKPNFKEIHKFGCQAYVHIPGEKRQKLDNKAEKLFFVGYSEESKAYRLINLKTDKITISRDVIFMENISIQEETKEFNENNENKDTDVYIDLETKEEVEEEPIQQIQQDQKNENNLRRSKRENKGVPPAKLSAYVHITKEQVLEPRSVAEALAGINKEEWQRALDEEYSSLLANNTWDITELPKGAKAIGCKWIFKLKRDASRNIVRYKTRLVALGCNQNYKIDYEEIFAPVVRQTTLRMLLSIAGKEKMIVKHYDIKNAFLNGNLKEIIYMKQPKGYEI